MSKSSRKSEPPRRSSKPERSRAGSYRNNGGAQKGSGARKISGTRTSGRGTPRGASHGQRQTGLSLGAVRISAEVVAAAALIGGIAWAVSAQGSYSAGVIVGLSILGLLAGLGLVTALQPAKVIRLVNRLARR